MALLLVDVDMWPDKAEDIVAEAFSGISHSITRLDQIGEVTSDCNGYPWKRLRLTGERQAASLEEGTPVYAQLA